MLKSLLIRDDFLKKSKRRSNLGCGHFYLPKYVALKPFRYSPGPDAGSDGFGVGSGCGCAFVHPLDS